MDSALEATAIGAGAALLGALLGSLGTAAVERFRVTEARKEDRRTELLSAMTKFFAAQSEWQVLLGVMPVEANDDYYRDLWNNARDLREGFATLKLIAPEEVRTWLLEDYRLIQDEFHDATIAYVEAGDSDAPDPRNLLAEKLYAEIERGVILCRSALETEGNQQASTVSGTSGQPNPSTPHSSS